MSKPIRRRAGPPSPFGSKRGPTKTYSISPISKRILASAARRCRTSESNVVDWLARAHNWSSQPMPDDFAIDRESVA